MLVDTKVIHVNSDNARGRSESRKVVEKSLKKSDSDRGGGREGSAASVRWNIRKRRSNDSQRDAGP